MTTHLTIIECSNGNQRRVKFQTNVRSEQTKWLAYRPTSSRRDARIVSRTDQSMVFANVPHIRLRKQRAYRSVPPRSSLFNARQTRVLSKLESVAEAGASKDPSLALANQIPCPERMDSICRIHALRGWILYVETTTDVYCGI